jgi:hypothetical protein
VRQSVLEYRTFTAVFRISDSAVLWALVTPRGETQRYRVPRHEVRQPSCRVWGENWV